MIHESKDIPSLKHFAQTIDERGRKMSGFFPVAKFNTNGLSSIAIRALTSEAQKRNVLCALAIERFRNDNKRLPSSLEELIPAYLPSVPTDAFDDHPIRYIKTPKGYSLYSVGEDLTDDKGKPRPHSEHYLYGGPTVKNTDIVFTVERP